ncbi:thioesterase family protein [Actinomadura roseirufa]|uniref:thioesterase family protein n=1 Tax=Actinomadura roseirufa TaxID=2094049 RepID=UPI001A9558CE|nr:hotdog domain-containing protein [Actinomadura roseirufa]
MSTANTRTATGAETMPATGREGTVEHRVGAADAASNWGNDLPVLATPVLLWLSEIAAMRAVERDVADDQMTVGVGHSSTHLAPTPVDDLVTVTARLDGVDGRVMSFTVTGHDGAGKILEGTHTRALVDRRRFQEGLDRRTRAS